MKKSIYSTENNKVVEKLISARKSAGLSQIQVAEKLGRTQSFVSKLEAGQRRIDIVLLKELASIYKKGIEYFA